MGRLAVDAADVHEGRDSDARDDLAGAEIAAACIAARRTGFARKGFGREGGGIRGFGRRKPGGAGRGDLLPAGGFGVEQPRQLDEGIEAVIAPRRAGPRFRRLRPARIPHQPERLL